MSRKKTILDAVYEQYYSATNMTARELKVWAKNPLSEKASLNRKPLIMAIRLKSRPKNKWRLTEIRWALRKAIPYLKRAKRIKGKNIIAKGYTKNQIALKNWGYDVKKKRRRY